MRERGAPQSSPRLSYTLASNPIWQSHNRITKAGPLANQSHASSHPYSPQSSSTSAAGNTRARTSARLLKPADHSSRCEDTAPARNLVGCGANSRPSRTFLSPSGRIQRVTIVLKDGENPRPQPPRPSFTRFLHRFLMFLPSSTQTRFMFLHTINISAPCSTGFKTVSPNLLPKIYTDSLHLLRRNYSFFLNTISLTAAWTAFCGGNFPRNCRFNSSPNLSAPDFSTPSFSVNSSVERKEITKKRKKKKVPEGRSFS